MLAAVYLCIRSVENSLMGFRNRLEMCLLKIGPLKKSPKSFLEVSVPVGVTRSLKHETVGQIRTCVNSRDPEERFQGNQLVSAV